MKIKLSLVIILIVIFCGGISAQSVVITGKKVTYTRKKPISDYKKTFTINYPKVKAATPMISKKIEKAISYEKVLNLRLKDELEQYQWLEEANFEVKYNKEGILCINLWMEGSAAYPSSTSDIVVVNIRTGNLVEPRDVFIDLSKLAAMVAKDQKKEAIEAAKKIKVDEPDITDPESLFDNAKAFEIKDLAGFEVTDRGVTFHYDYAFPHVVQALQPSGEFAFTWKQLKPYIKPGSLLSRLAR